MKAICISLDFELRWGVRHLYRGDFSKYKIELDGAKAAALALCDLFHEREIPSTWATVGALGLSGWEEFFNKITLNELNERSNFKASSNELTKTNEDYYFAPEVIKHLCSSNQVEIASHTFSHLFCCEPHVSEDLFLEEGKLFNEVFNNKYGKEVKSIVYPRNQVKFEELLPQLGISSYREIEKGDTAYANTLKGNSLTRKIFRASSSINPFISHSSPFAKQYSRASLFLRLNLPAIAWQLHLARIRSELRNLRDGECFHLWMHPHNLGSNTDFKLKRIDQVIKILLELRDRKEYKIMSMKGLNEYARKNEIEQPLD